MLYQARPPLPSRIPTQLPIASVQLTILQATYCNRLEAGQGPGNKATSHPPPDKRGDGQVRDGLA